MRCFSLHDLSLRKEGFCVIMIKSGKEKKNKESTNKESTNMVKEKRGAHMLTSKQRSYLRGLANTLVTVINIGKAGVTPEVTQSADEALAARELIKLNVLDNTMIGAKEAAGMIAERTHSDIVQVIGSKFVLYRPAKKPVIKLPEAK